MMSFYVTDKSTWIILVAVRCGCECETIRQRDDENAGLEVFFLMNRCPQAITQRSAS